MVHALFPLLKYLSMARVDFKAPYALTESRCVIHSLCCRIKQTNNEHDRRDNISFCPNEVTNGPKTDLI